MSGYDPDGIAQTEADYFEIWPVCGEWFDVRDMAQMAMHIHDLTDVEIAIGKGRRREKGRCSERRSQRPPPDKSCGLALAITALVAISVYYGIL
jgi:hypothetical protein